MSTSTEISCRISNFPHQVILKYFMLYRILQQLIKVKLIYIRLIKLFLIFSITSQNLSNIVLIQSLQRSEQIQEVICTNGPTYRQIFLKIHMVQMQETIFILTCITFTILSKQHIKWNILGQRKGSSVNLLKSMQQVGLELPNTTST